MRRINKKKIIALILLITVIIIEIVAFRNSTADRVIEMSVKLIDADQELETVAQTWSAISSDNSYYVTNQKLNKGLQKDNLAIGVELAVKHCESIFTLEIGEFYKRLRYIKLNKENILENYQDIEDVLNSYKEVYKKYFSRGGNYE